MPVGEVTVRMTLDNKGYSAGMTEARRQAQQTTKVIQEMGHSTVSSMQASSAAIRVLEGGMTGNIRAAERFISMIPGVGKALQAAFPLVGGIALAGVFVKIGEEAARAITKIQQAQQAITNSFQSLNIAGMSANDTLRITNDRLENEIAKLQGKPQNNLALAIDEARLAADKMAESLDRDNAKIKELLSQNAVPWWAGFLGKAGTGNVSDAVNKQNQDLANLSNQAAVLQHTDPAAAAKIRAQIDAQRLQDIQDNAKDMAARQANQKLPGGLNQGANIAIDYGQQASLYNQIDQQNELKRNVADQATKQQLEDQKAQQEAAKRAAEAMKQAQELIVQQWRRNFDEAKADNDMTLAQEAQFWVQRMESAKKGSLSYIAALQEANKDIARMRSENMKGQGAFDQTSSLIYGAPEDLSKGDTGIMKEQGREAADYLKALNQGISIHRESANALAEESIQMEVLTGRMSRLDAAQALAALHTQEYREAQSALQSALANANSLPDSLSKQATIAGLNSQGAQIEGQRQMQVAGDQQKIAGQTLGPALQQALGTIANEWVNMTHSIVQIVTRGIDSLNDDIAKLATGQGKKGDFGRTFSQAGEGLVKTALQSAEGNILKAFHVGSLKKADGSQNNPFYVIPAGQGGTGGGAGGALPAFVRPFIGGQPQAQGGPSGGGQQGGGSIWGQLLKAFLPGLKLGGGGAGGGPVDYDGFFQGGFASGGDVVANRPALIGESGPEIFTPRTAGTITPNSQIGGGGHTFNIDARGSNDPAAVHAAVMRAAPHIAAAGVQATHQNRMRSPGGR